MKIINKKIDEISPDPNQPRKYEESSGLTTTDDKLNQFLKSVKEKGIIQPITIDENNVIICGEGRWRMAKKVELKEVPCIIKKGLSSTEKLELQMIENLQRNDMNFNEIVKGIKRLSSDPNYLKSKRKGERYKGLKEIAKTIGMSETWISQLLSLDKNAPLWLKQEINNGKTSISKALKIIREIDMGRKPKENIKKVEQIKDILERDIMKLSSGINKINLDLINNSPTNIKQIKTAVSIIKNKNLKDWNKLEKKVDYWSKQGRLK